MTHITLINFNDSLRDGMASWPNILHCDWKPNYGDMLVCASIKRKINSADFHMIAFGEELSEKTDLAVMRGSTYLHNEFDFAKAIATIDSIDAPIAVVGLGAQNRWQDFKFLDDNRLAHEFVRKISEKSTSISARGAFSASILERLGATNVRITGCPSLFYYSDTPQVELPNLLYTEDRRIGLSVHTGLSENIYCRDPQRVFSLHQKVLLNTINMSKHLRIFEQGTPLEFLISSPNENYEDRNLAAIEFLEKLSLSEIIRPAQLISLFSSFSTVEEWLAKARDFDAFIGFRFHGNMVALNQGIPCYYYTYDSRLEEFCALYKLPHHRLESDFKDPVSEILHHDWSATNQAIKECSENMSVFWQENGVPVTVK
jgi:hypothetical protein